MDSLSHLPHSSPSCLGIDHFTSSTQDFLSSQRATQGHAAHTAHFLSPVRSPLPLTATCCSSLASDGQLRLPGTPLGQSRLPAMTQHCTHAQPPRALALQPSAVARALQTKRRRRSLPSAHNREHSRRAAPVCQSRPQAQEAPSPASKYRQRSPRPVSSRRGSGTPLRTVSDATAVSAAARGTRGPL